MLSIDNLSFSYDKHNVLKNLSFSVNTGETVFLLGKNGAGKSTLYKCMLGILKGYTGTISANNKNIKNISIKELAKEIGYVPQSHAPTFNYSVLDMVLMGTASDISSYSSPNKKHIEKAVKALEIVGISSMKDNMYMHLSGGEKQLVMIARALAQGAKILFMDEPTSSLDYGNQIRVLDIISDLAKMGYTIIISSHNPQQAMSYGGRIIALDRGRIIANGSPDNVINQQLIEQLYGIKIFFQDTEYGKIIVPRCNS